MADGANATIAGNDGVQPPQLVELAGSRRAKSGSAPGCRAIEHYHDRTVMIVMLATELEQVIDGRSRNASLLHPRLRVTGNDRAHSHSYHPSQRLGRDAALAAVLSVARNRTADGVSFVVGMLGSVMRRHAGATSPIIRPWWLTA